MNRNIQNKNARWLALGAVLLIGMASGSGAVTHQIQFGGTLGIVFSPASLNAKVGDTIEWMGAFSTHPLSSTTIPTGAASWHMGSGTTFKYAIKVPGTYDYQCDVHFSMGMIGSFIATTGTGVAMDVPSPVLKSFSMRILSFLGKNSVQLFMPYSSPVTMNVLSLAGEKIPIFANRSFALGIRTIALPDLSKGFYVIRVIMDGKEFSKPLAITQ
jgi:plastocyanin